MLKHFLVAAALTTATLVVAPPAEAADTPTCVTRAEYRAVSRGMTKARVHQIFDIAGHRDAISWAGGYGAEIRSYRPCSRYSAVSIAYEKRPGGVWRLSAKSAVWSG